MARRQSIEPLHRDVLYWKLKSLEHDVLDPRHPEYRSVWVEGKRVLVPAEQALAFKWWLGLTPLQRKKFLLRARSVDAKPLSAANEATLAADDMSNPLLQLVRAEERQQFDDPNNWGRAGRNRPKPLIVPEVGNEGNRQA
jgi:hypothetical protein